MFTLCIHYPFCRAQTAESKGLWKKACGESINREEWIGTGGENYDWSRSAILTMRRKIRSAAVCYKLWHLMTLYNHWTYYAEQYIYIFDAVWCVSEKGICPRQTRRGSNSYTSLMYCSEQFLFTKLNMFSHVHICMKYACAQLLWNLNYYETVVLWLYLKLLQRWSMLVWLESNSLRW